jgi:transcriptional regulator with XRE-family HTH domain
MAPRRTRPISEQWLAAAQNKRKIDGLSYKQLGEKMARVMERATPYSIPAVSDVLRGRAYSAEMIEALAAVLDLDLPPVAAAGDPRLEAWADAGGQLLDLSPQHFDRELTAVRKLVEALDDFERRR